MKQFALAACLFAFAGSAVAVQRPGSQPAPATASPVLKSKCTLNGKVVKETKVLKAGNVVPGVDSVLTTGLKGMTEKTKQCELEFGYGTAAKFERLGHYCWPGGQSERGLCDGPCE